MHLKCTAGSPLKYFCKNQLQCLLTSCRIPYNMQCPVTEEARASCRCCVIVALCNNRHANERVSEPRHEMKTPFALNYVNTKLTRCDVYTKRQLGNHSERVSHCASRLPYACGLCVCAYARMQIGQRNIAERAAGGADRLPLL